MPPENKVTWKEETPTLLCEACGGFGRLGGVPELQGDEVTCRDCGGTGRLPCPDNVIPIGGRSGH